MRETLPKPLTAVTDKEGITADDLPGVPALRHPSRLFQDSPMVPATHEVTRLLKDWSAGDQSALDRLMPLVYDELHRLARRYMRQEQPGHMLQTSALVNEAYLRLVDVSQVQWQNRAHFFGIAARLMRRILVDDARHRHFQKRGGGAVQVPLDEAVNLPQRQAANLVALDDALKDLAKSDPRQSEIVELRFFGGLSVEETAEVLKVSPGTVARDWTFARAWLHAVMGGEVEEADS